MGGMIASAFTWCASSIMAFAAEDGIWVETKYTECKQDMKLVEDWIKEHGDVEVSLEMQETENWQKEYDERGNLIRSECEGNRVDNNGDDYSFSQSIWWEYNSADQCVVSGSKYNDNESITKYEYKYDQNGYLKRRFFFLRRGIGE